MNNKTPSNSNTTLKKARRYKACDECGEYWVNLVTLRDRVTGREQLAQQCSKCEKLEIVTLPERTG